MVRCPLTPASRSAPPPGLATWGPKASSAISSADLDSTRSPCGPRAIAGWQSVAAGLVTLALTTTGATGAVASSSGPERSRREGHRPSRRCQTGKGPCEERSGLGTAPSRPQLCSADRRCDARRRRLHDCVPVEHAQSRSCGRRTAVKDWDVVSPKLGSRNADSCRSTPTRTSTFRETTRTSRGLHDRPDRGVLLPLLHR